MRLLRGLVTLVLVAAIAVTAFVAFANWSKNGEFSLRVFDPQWWTVGKAEAQPYLDEASEKAKHVYAAVWDQGGLVDQAQDWLKEVRERRAKEPASATAAPATSAAPATTAPASAPKPAPAPAAPQKSKATRQVEERLTAAEELFQDAVGHYQAGDPRQGGFTDAKKRELDAAKKDCEQVRDILDKNLDQYEKLPDHDAQRAADARRMQHYNQQMLFNAGKMGGGI